MKPKKVERDVIGQRATVAMSEVEKGLRNAEDNFQYGLQLHQVIEQVPTSDMVEEGQIIFGKDGSTWKLYTKLNGSLHEVALTATS